MIRFLIVIYYPYGIYIVKNTSDPKYENIFGIFYYVKIKLHQKLIEVHFAWFGFSRQIATRQVS